MTKIHKCIESYTDCYTIVHFTHVLLSSWPKNSPNFTKSWKAFLRYRVRQTELKTKPPWRLRSSRNVYSLPCKAHMLQPPSSTEF